MSVSPEDQLLIQCSRTTMSEQSLMAASRLLRQDLNWDYLLEVSIRHAVSPLFYRGLTQLSPVPELDRRVPGEILGELRKLYRSTRSRNRRLYRALGDIVKAFTQADIQAVGLKDVQLAREVYPDIGLRPMGDVDLLIHPEDYQKAAKCMKDLGFRPLPGPDIPFTLKYAWAHAFRRPTDNVWVDMQWNIVQREWDIYHEGNFDFDIARVWHGAVSMAVDDYQILVPRPEDMLFHLCLHLEGHQYCELILFCDIVEFLRHYEHRLDWDYFVRISKNYKAESSVYYVLLLVQQLFGTPLPPSLLRELEPTYAKANIFSPLFENLTPLHLSLDEIRLSVSPPDELMKSFEGVVRRQTIGAMQAYREIDTLASSFVTSGGSLILFNGAPSEKVLPDSSLKAFQDLRAFILDRDLSGMQRSLLRSGFTPAAAANSEAYVKECEIISADPALAHQPTLMALRVNVEREVGSLLSHAETGRRTKRGAALSSLRAKLGDRGRDNACLAVQINIVALSPEDLFLYLCAQLARKVQDRLFAICNLLEFFRGYSGPLDWQYIARTATQHDVGRLVGEGMMMVSEFVNCGRIPASAPQLLACADMRPRVLEWARYGPNSLIRRPEFKGPFFFLFSLFSLQGANKRCRFFLRSLAKGREGKPLLLSLLLELSTGALSLIRRPRPTTKDFAYWIEPEPAVDINSASDLLSRNGSQPGQTLQAAKNRLTRPRFMRRVSIVKIKNIL